jgi:uncharacterized membrane protein YccF (DUF307 family)
VIRTILNIIWLVLAGFWLAVGYLVAGIIVSIFIITIPIGIQSFKLAGYALWPFGRTVVKKESAGGGSVVGNVIWVVLAGWWLALAHLITALLQAITIIGIPLAIANAKMARLAIWPFGREIVSSDEVSDDTAEYRIEARPLSAGRRPAVDPGRTHTP